MNNILERKNRSKELFKRGTWKLVEQFGLRENSYMSVKCLGYSIKFFLLYWLKKKV